MAVAETAKVEALAAQGLSKAEIRGLLKRDLLPEELRAAAAGRGVWKLKEAKRKEQKGEAKSGAARMRRLRSQENEIERRQPEDMARRKRLEKNPEKWLRWYFPNIFSLPFADGHRSIIEAILKSDANGKNMVVAAPRGEGKTNIMRYMTIFLVFTGRSRFPVMGGWQTRSASEAFSAWKIALTSERLVADYPEFCEPFAISTHANRLPRLHWKGEAKPCGAAIESLKMLIVFPDGRGAMVAGSLQGDIKGLNVSTVGGLSLRPDKLLLDDPQDVTRAEDPVFVEKTLHQIDTQWLCLAGPDVRISMMVACTIFAPNDVGESLGKRKDSVFVRISRVTSWPKDFDRAESLARTLWERWFDLYCDDKSRTESFAFYRRNKKAMTDGFSVSWRYRYDQKKGDPDALFSAMVDYFTKGRDAFFSEYQNQPVGHDTKIYELTPQHILARRVSLRENEVPQDAVFTALTTDINYYGLTYEVATFTRSRTCHVVARGVFCESPLPVSEKSNNEVLIQEKIGVALRNFATWVMSQPWSFDVWLVDAGGKQFDTVWEFCKSMKKAGLPVRAITGRAGKTYKPPQNPNEGRLRNRVYLRTPESGRRWFCFDADHYKEMAQMSWIVPAGQTGSATIYDGSHREYAIQMCNEILSAKGILESRTGAALGYAYRWDTRPGRHDYLDIHAMAMAAAGWEGILSTTGTGDERNHARAVSGRNRRKIYHG